MPAACCLLSLGLGFTSAQIEASESQFAFKSCSSKQESLLLFHVGPRLIMVVHVLLQPKQLQATLSDSEGAGELDSSILANVVSSNSIQFYCLALSQPKCQTHIREDKNTCK